MIVGFGFVIMLKVLVVFIGLLFVGLLFVVFMIVSKIKVNKKLMLYVFIINKYRIYKGVCILIKLEFGIWGLLFYRNY